MLNMSFIILLTLLILSNGLPFDEDGDFEDDDYDHSEENIELFKAVEAFRKMKTKPQFFNQDCRRDSDCQYNEYCNSVRLCVHKKP
uniref:Uncharacterized protein n=1 Tax=Romanomermis culicivorax TaxID=13658 RepID=A0A915JXM7_ROMCU